jgi:hypothetical protein
MLKPTATPVLSGVVAHIAAAGVASTQNAMTNLLVGDTKVETLSSYKGPGSLPKPAKILVDDFVVPGDVESMDESMATRIHRRHMLLWGANAEASPEDVAGQVRASFSKALASELQKSSVPTETAVSADTAIPVHILTVQSEFTAVNEGNRSKRAMIGFGLDASDVQAHVTVSLTSETHPIVLSEFKLKS